MSNTGPTLDDINEVSTHGITCGCMQCHPLEANSENEDHTSKGTDSSEEPLSEEGQGNTDDTHTNNDTTNNTYSDYQIGVTASVIAIIASVSTLIASISYNIAKNKFDNSIIDGEDFQQAETELKRKSSRIWGVSYSASGGTIATGVAIVALGATNPFIPVIAVGALLVSGVAGAVTGRSFASKYTSGLVGKQSEIESTTQPAVSENKAITSNQPMVEKQWINKINTTPDTQIKL